MPTTLSITIRAEVPAQPGAFGQVMAAIGDAGGEVVGVEVVRSTKATVTRDIIVQVRGDEGSEAAVTAISGVAGVKVHEVTDRVFLSHAGRQDDDAEPRGAHEPGRPLDGLHARRGARLHGHPRTTPEQVWDLTIRANTVMVVSDGSSVVGQGDLGPEAALPAVEAQVHVPARDGRHRRLPAAGGRSRPRRDRARLTAHLLRRWSRLST